MNKVYRRLNIVLSYNNLAFSSSHELIQVSAVHLRCFSKNTHTDDLQIHT